MVLSWFQKKGKKAETPPSGPTQAAPAPVRGAARAPQGPSISRLLGEDLVLLSPAFRDKDELVELMVRRLCAAKALPGPEAFLQKVLEREQGISTTLDTGLSLPHARVDGLPDIVAVLSLLPRGIQDPKQPELLIRAMFLFFSPNVPAAFGRHLQLLRSVSALFQPVLIEQLAAAQTPSQALELLRRKESGD